MGYHDAPVVVLLANPGSNEQDWETETASGVRELALNNLLAEGATRFFIASISKAPRMAALRARAVLASLTKPNKDASCVPRKA